MAGDLFPAFSRKCMGKAGEREEPQLLIITSKVPLLTGSERVAKLSCASESPAVG